MKRSRYTVTAEDGSKHVILAYDAAGARQYYELRGLNVTRIEHGDYRKVAAHAAIREGGGFKIDQEALADAISLLDLERTVNIRFDARVGDTRGNYRLTGGRHNIMLKSWLTVEQASHTLWHELTHAMQAERVLASGGSWGAFATAQKRRWSYSRRPIEREANQMADDMRDCLLTVSYPSGTVAP